MGEKIGSFQVLGTLGTGAHSTIMQIRRNSDGKLYALKVVKLEEEEDHKFMEQSEHEFEVAQKLDHVNLIKIYAMEKIKSLGFFGKVKEVRTLVEYVHGQTLDKFKVIPMAIVVQIFEAIANGMVMMHRRNICHGDLKPNNIMIGRAGKVKIIDYGLAWVKGENKERIQGTPEYMAPEQISKKLVNEQTDIFNFGATMYRMLTFRHIPRQITADSAPIAINAEGWKEQLKPVMSINVNCPKKLAVLTEKCVSFKPTSRPERMTEVAEELKGISQELVKTDLDSIENWEWT